MTANEAVELVIQAAPTGRGGKALVLDMGAPVKTDDVARHPIDLSGADIAVQYTGLHPGEKLHEDPFTAGEFDYRPNHLLLPQVDIPALEATARCLGINAPRGN